ncbi:MAG TPA: SDR family NAD(P)-dependent oxidoreductase [Pirellulales bacterium]|jgi:acyl transferase domain-containing protein|nr:SDR family NAD(P)-dependent oxidoreductase [Pirellulales bacterium]
MAIPTDHSDIPLAIIGMGCRLPGADNLDQYWELVSQGRSSIAEVPPNRLDQELYYHPDKGVRGKTYSKLAALLSNRGVDLTRYPIAEELRRSVDPMHLIMTAVAADAVRQAGLDPFNLPHKNSAVFIGHAVGSSQLRDLTYASLLDEALAILDNVEGLKGLAPAEREALIAECRAQILDELGPTPQGGRDLYCNMVAGTVAKAFGLTGPWLALNSACASSLHAMLMGARALQQGRVDMVIAGGASDCGPHTLVLFSAAQAMSATASRPFDANADGLIMSEGYVAVVMKTLERALADGDPIQAVVRGLGVATDGRGKSLWAPRKEGQVKAMQRAYRGGVDMAGLQYLECHATATQLGDATELETLGEVLGPKMPAGKRIAITSVKANIGHSLEAAGVAGLIKTVLAMQHRTIPPAINLETLNPKIDWQSAPYYIPQAAAPWSAPAGDEPRRAAVNAFGIGGLNMHVVLDEFNETYHRKLLAGTRSHAPGASRNGSSAGTNGSSASSNGSPASNAADHADDKSVAIIGMGCIFPGAEGLPKFWERLTSGDDPKTAPAEPRWSPLALGETEGKPLVGGFITDFQYNWRKHKVPPKQIAEADPLQFMFLEAAEQALADAGYDRKPLDRERCGVMVGTEFGGDFCDELEMGLRLPEMTHVLGQLLARRQLPAEKIEQINTEFSNTLIRKWPSLVDETGSFTTSTLASRISKTLDLAGGAVAIDSGSTSALSGLSICVDMLLSGDNDVMICAAGQRRMGRNGFRALENAGMLAFGQPHSVLDAQYDGIVPAEGVGVVVLKRLADARRDGDRIHAVLRGIGLAHHASQAEALRMAVERSSAMAGISPTEISVEELETDEPLDASGAELETLAALHASGQRRAPLAMASGTAQFGHLGGASGMAALIKASLEIEHGETAPTAGLKTPAPVLEAWHHAVVATPGSTKLSGRRLVGISCWSHGLACHLILEHGAAIAARPTTAAAHGAQMAAPQPARTTVAQRAPVAANGNGHHLPTHSRIPARAGAVQSSPASLVGAGTATSHGQQAEGGRPARGQAPARPAATPRAAAEWQICRLAGGTHGELLADIDQALSEPAAAWRAAAARGFVAGDKFRLAVVADSAESLCDKLRLARPQLENLAARNVLEQQGIFYRPLPSVRPQVAFVFPGQGSQYSGMLRPLVEKVPAAARALTEIDAVMSRLSHPKFADLAWSAEDRLGKDVWTTQVSMLLADSLLLAALADRGVRPDLVLGHSYGEFVALYAAGAWDFATAVRMTQARCAGIEAAVAGGETGMLATDAAAELIEQLSSSLGLDVYVANLNAPDQCVVGGTRKHLAELASALTAQGRQAKMLAVPGAFHTPLLSAASRPLEEALRGATIGAPQVKFVSTVNNSVIGDPAEIRRNLARQLTTPVRYAQLIGRLAAESPTVFVEVGPQQTLTRLNRRILGSAADVIASDNPKRSPWEPLLGVQALLECLGACPASTPKAAPAGSQPQVAQPAAAQPAAKPATLVKPQPAVATAPQTATKGTIALSDQRSTSSEIPHFDATERRREKMRSAGGPAGARAAHVAAPETAKPAPPIAKPAPAAVKPAPQPAPPATKPAPAVRASVPAPAAKPLPAPAKPSPAAATKPLPATPITAHSNGASNGSASHHAASRSAPASAPVAAAAPPQASAPQNAAPRAGSPGTGATELEAFLINFVVEQTGYPAEVVDLDADLEADLGIDSIKKAQLFGELQEYFDISALGAGGAAGGTLSLDDFTTLRHVLDFLVKSAPGASTGTAIHGVPSTAAVAQPTAAAVVAQPDAPAPVAAHLEVASTATVGPGTNAAELEAFLINFVVEQTGYPAEVVDLDADLEADLGIDSIKKAQLFGELQEYFDISALSAGGAAGGTLSLDDFTTLRHVLDFLVKSTSAGGHASAASTAQPDVASVAEPPPQAIVEPAATAAAVPEAAPANGAPGTSAAELESFLINFVVEQTGYPAEVVDLDADLEADLGIDSIKKAQLFGELQEYFDISALGAAGAGGGTLSLDDFITLRHVLDFLAQTQPGAATTASIEQVIATTDPAPAVATLFTHPAPAPAAQLNTTAATGSTTAEDGVVAEDSAERASELEAFLINFVVEQTGYPAEVVDLDADLEADLGIDSIKKAQLFGELQEYFDISALSAGSSAGGTLSLDDFTTLRHVLDFLIGASPAHAVTRGPLASGEPTAPDHAPDRSEIPVNVEVTDANHFASAEAPESAAAEAVELAGTPYELGWQHGRQFKAEIQRVLRHYADCVGERLDELPGHAASVAPERLLSADELDELQGLADAVEVPLGNLLAHHLALTSELGDGAGQMASPAGFTDGSAQWIHAFKQPAPLVGTLRAVAQPVVFARCPAGEIAHLAVSYLGCVGMLGGLNAAGVAITAYRLDGPTSSASGVASSTVVRTVLGSATNLEQAIELTQALALAGGPAWAALISSAGANEAVAIEFDGRELSVQSAPATIAMGDIGLPAAAEATDAATLAAQLASGSQLGAGTAAMSRTLAPAVGSECVGLVIEPAQGKLWLSGSAAADGKTVECWSTNDCLPAWDANFSPMAAVLQAGQESPPALLPTEPVTSRFSLEMREAPLPPGTPTEPAWTGQAIVLGTGATAEALRHLLERSGASVQMLVPGNDAEAVLAELEAICSHGPAPHLFLTTARDCPPIDPYHIELWDEQHYATMMLPFLVCQKWTHLAAAGGWLDRATLVATTAQGGDFGLARGGEASQGGALAGLLKAIFVEFAIMQNLKNLRIKVVDAPLDASPDILAGQVLAELGSNNLAYEVAYVGSRRLVPYAIERNVGEHAATSTGGLKTRPGSAVRHGSTWVATGGARGITAAAAMEFGRRFGLKLHLIGTTPLAEVDPARRDLTTEELKKLKASVMIAARNAGKQPVQAWQRVEKDLEIDRTLRAFAAAGVSVTYHACDVSDRAALAETLDRIRQADGPIAGIVHGAGIERSCRFDRKQRDVVLQTIRVKVDGTANLMALTRRDPIRHFIVFGSISGRVGGFGQADYSLANEMACKLLGSYRHARPWVQAVGFHWHAWDEVGMAARPETKNNLQEKGSLALMPLAEGLAHLVRELAAGTPEPEVMITERHHWERFAAGLGTLADEVRGSAAADPAKAPLPLLTDIVSDADSTVGQVALDPSADQFLIEHRLRGKALLPVVVGLEALAEAVRVASGQSVVGFRDIDMIDGLLFHVERPVVARARATRLPDGMFDCRLTSDFHNRNGGLIQADRLYLTTKAATAGVPAAPLATISPHSGEWRDFRYPNEAPIYHGPVFRGLRGCCYGPAAGTARVLALPMKDLVGEARLAGWTIPSCVLDSAMYACAMHLWAFGGNAIALPRRIADLRLVRQPRDGEMCLVHFVCLDLAAGNYDFDVVGEDGTIIMQARGYGHVIFARGVSV